MRVRSQASISQTFEGWAYYKEDEIIHNLFKLYDVFSIF